MCRRRCGDRGNDAHGDACCAAPVVDCVFVAVEVMFSVYTRLIAVTMLHNGVCRNNIYERVGVTRSTLNRWKRYYRDHESVWRDTVLRNRHEDNCAFDMTLLSAIVTLVRENTRGLLREH